MLALQSPGSLGTHHVRGGSRRRQKPCRCEQLVLEKLFGRNDELAYLKRFVRTPGRLLLLTGPPDCGKSAVLRQLTKEEAGVSLIDLRGGDFTTAGDFTRRLRGELGRNKLLSLDNVDVNSMNVTLFGTTKEHLEFQQVLLNFLYERKRFREAAPVPTLILDEANALQDWVADEANQKALISFLEFFVKITKQDNLANVVLASSDYFFKFWLDKQIGGSRYSKLAVGDLPEDEARGFFDYRLGYPCSTEIWKDVYNTCGGRALLLKRSADYLRSWDGAESHWADFREELYDQAYDEVCSGLESENLVTNGIAVTWKAGDCMQLMSELCKHPNGVMAWKDFQTLCGTSVARALVCNNLVHCRMKSKLARDLAWYTGAWPVVMPVSQVHFLAMQDVVCCRSLDIVRCEEFWKECPAFMFLPLSFEYHHLHSVGCLSA